MLLIYPPVAKSCEPPAGIARLAGSLKGHNISCQIVDCNLEGLLFLVETAGKPLDTWGKRAFKNRHLNLDLIKTDKLYQNVDAYKKAVIELNKVIDHVGRKQNILLSLANLLPV